MNTFGVNLECKESGLVYINVIVTKLKTLNSGSALASHKVLGSEMTLRIIMYK